jgi:hypothetical protein
VPGQSGTVPANSVRLRPVVAAVPPLLCVQLDTKTVGGSAAESIVPPNRGPAGQPPYVVAPSTSR